MAAHNTREAGLGTVCIIATLAITGGLFHALAQRFYQSYTAHNTPQMIVVFLFAAAMAIMAYGNLLYQVCLVGYYKRKEAHTPASRSEIESLHTAKTPSLSIIIPSYKEEHSIVWQTMMSAALSEYPDKNVVLLIDDPYAPRSLEDRVKLEETRAIPVTLQKQFGEEAAFYASELAAFRERVESGSMHADIELNRISVLYDRVADWLEQTAERFAAGRADAVPHAERFFIDTVLAAPSTAHRQRAVELRARMTRDAGTAFLTQEYARLAGLFRVNFASFERKKYVNLSHEANKAMNLNSYIGLIGKAWKEEEAEDGLHLRETTPANADFIIPAADYVNTIDADSLMTHDYVIRVVHMMELPENQRVAVVQSPCSAFPGCPEGLERIAGASIDVQFLTHQGYTHWNATFWVGANAMLRHTALEEIKETRREGNHMVSIYIQDHTVIEDTESTIDLVSKGWQLRNYPERMSFSATPPDFGSLLIQRRRWANGGLLILPKLFRYIAGAPKNLALMKELFMRFHYLASTTTGCVVALLLFLFPFGDMVNGPWLTLATIPFFTLYLRDLKHSGYKWSDALRIYALNLVLLPVITGGVLKSFEQILTGKKIPFGRTPKITGRTAIPAFYLIIEAVLPMLFIAMSSYNLVEHHYSQAVFGFINSAIFSYGVLKFIGLSAMKEDLVAAYKERFGTPERSAEIIRMPRRRVTGMLLPVRKRA